MARLFEGIRIKNIVIILLGTLLFGFGIIHFNMQNGLAHGGFTGITLLIYYLFTIEPSLTNLLLNVPLFLIGYKLLGRVMLIYSIIGTLALSGSLRLFELYPVTEIPLQNDMILVSLFAGVCVGAGLGFIFRAGGTTGGADILARLANKYIGMSLGRFMFTFDAFVITISMIHLNMTQAMYTLVTVFVASRVIDFIIEGASAAKSTMIISSKTEEISAEVIKRMSRGSTVLTGKGSFTQDNREIMYCVVNRNELIQLKAIIEEIDPYAFFSINDVKEVSGEGFTFDQTQRQIKADQSSKDEKFVSEDKLVSH
ncbi:YitT family protein [Bacillus sp. H-16]|uniref:YitT family protein n=1 Tax=Alteribacter salitolerans TaxID=2912333 RepID=UPI00196242B8|nr:YitT family protein [Alteribacter salitolerans]MBM7096318.1 YitT family protein [Alteribacter salitolerans]